MNGERPRSNYKVAINYCFLPTHSVTADSKQFMLLVFDVLGGDTTNVVLLTHDMARFSCQFGAQVNKTLDRTIPHPKLGVMRRPVPTVMRVENARGK